MTSRFSYGLPRAACAVAMIVFVCMGAMDSVRAADNHPVRRIKVLFLGDEGHHVPLLRARQLIPVASQVGIDITYTEDVGDLNPVTLNRYDDLLIYANIGMISPEHEKALLDYVEGGHGLVALHCASYCFLNSPKYIALVGAQFAHHKTGVFRTKIVAPDHPIMKGFQGFESWDETYVHTKHNTENRTVLEMRDTEPYTWVRTQGQGRVFYTAWGHDERTWGNPRFPGSRGARHSLGGGGLGDAAAAATQALRICRRASSPSICSRSPKGHNGRRKQVAADAGSFADQQQSMQAHGRAAGIFGAKYCSPAIR